MNKNSKIYIAGHRGMVGSAIKRKLEIEGYSNLIFKTREELDLMDDTLVKEFFKKEKPEYVFMTAAKVGGIEANRTYPADFIYQNSRISLNVIHNAYLGGVKKLMYFSSNCAYPRGIKQPMKEEYLMTSTLEPTNEAYSIAKILGTKLCQFYKQQYGVDFFTVMPCNLYGPFDDFDLKTSHVLTALIRKFYDAKINNDSEVIVWGSGTPRREFMYVDDLADACVFLMSSKNAGELLNIGVGSDVSILELAETIRKIVNYKGKITLDKSKSDGIPRKLLDSGRLIHLGWRPKTTLEEGVKRTYDWFLENVSK